MSGGSQVHIFWGAPIAPLKITVSEDTASLMSVADPWKKIQLLYSQHSLYLKDEKQHKNLENYKVPESIGSPDLSGHFLANCMNRHVHVKDDFVRSVSETQNIESQKIHSSRLSDITSSNMQICGFKSTVPHFTEEEKYQKLLSENKIRDEQPKHQPDICVLAFRMLSLKFLVCSFFLKNMHPECWIMKSLECCTSSSWLGSGEPLFFNVVIHEDQWIGETVLQSTFSSQLLNLGSYSSIQPEEYSSVVSEVVLQDLLAYVSSKHSYLRDLPPRQPQRVNSIDFVELEHLQPDVLVHAVLRVVDFTILTEAVYSYRGQKQKKVMLTVEQAQDQHYALVLWGPGAAWYPQLQRKKGYIWEFKYLFVQCNYTLENLELHTTPWSSCECLFDDDIRAITFKAKFQKSAPSFVKISDLATHLEDKCSGVVLIKAQISELAFPITASQKIALNAHSSLKSIFSSLPNIVYTGCAKCGLELETDENRIYKQCFSCLPFTMKKIYYRPALMTAIDGRHDVCIRVESKLIEKILLNISADCLNRVIVPSSEITYGMVVADLFHSLLAVSAEPCVLKIQSLFVLDENSYPLQQDFSLLDFYPDIVKHGANARL
ncbi:shieldin complex subunit 2 isoform X9 [Homo sapiens]|uniref:shieldin complex subunit 2 isoform X9 n=1 Tax=Homo sapiens TaxID=9606 RepID=UPI0005D03EDE|nr:shieldin complex subunit 2 isoform X9 [Homo sapiens]